MARLHLTRTGLRDGTWQGILTGDPDGPAPALILTHLGRRVADADLTADGPGRWTVRVAIPARCLAEGWTSFMIQEIGGHDTLAAFSFLADDGEDLRGEVALLRAELDLLKGAVRRHFSGAA